MPFSLLSWVPVSPGQASLSPGRVGASVAVWGALNDASLIAAGGVGCFGITAVLFLLLATSHPCHTGLLVLVGLEKTKAESESSTASPKAEPLLEGTRARRQAGKHAPLQSPSPVSPFPLQTLSSCTKSFRLGRGPSSGVFASSLQATHLHGIHDNGESRIIPEEVRVFRVSGNP